MKNSTEDIYVDIPETYKRRKLNAMYREIPLKDTTSRLLRKYFNAMANLYGIITLGKAWEIISSQNADLVSKEEFFAFVEIARHECEDYRIMKDSELYLDGKPAGRLDWKIIDIMLLYDDGDALREVEICQQGKEYFIPPKKELLCYTDPSCCVPVLQRNRMWEFLIGELHLDEQKADFAFEDILLFTHCLDGGIKAVIGVVERLGAVFDRRTLSEFASVYQDFNNHTRMQCNRGYTPTEMAAVMKRKDRIPKLLSFGSNMWNPPTGVTTDAGKSGTLTAELPDNRLSPFSLHTLEEAAATVPKVGRNDPCPCGSGKKYKKCCGR